MSFNRSQCLCLYLGRTKSPQLPERSRVFTTALQCSEHTEIKRWVTQSEKEAIENGKQILKTVTLSSRVRVSVCAQAWHRKCESLHTSVPFMFSLFDNIIMFSCSTTSSCSPVQQHHHQFYHPFIDLYINFKILSTQLFNHQLTRLIDIITIFIVTSSSSS